jgi:hypothetical protein
MHIIQSMPCHEDGGTSTGEPVCVSVYLSLQKISENRFLDFCLHSGTFHNVSEFYTFNLQPLKADQKKTNTQKYLEISQLQNGLK